jgi:hypothetical protein
MVDLPRPTRHFYYAIALAAVVVILGVSSASGWLSYTGYLALTAVGPLAILAIVLVGVWSGVRYVRSRPWQD